MGPTDNRYSSHCQILKLASFRKRRAVFASDNWPFLLEEAETQVSRFSRRSSYNCEVIIIIGRLLTLAYTAIQPIISSILAHPPRISRTLQSLIVSTWNRQRDSIHLSVL